MTEETTETSRPSSVQIKKGISSRLVTAVVIAIIIVVIVCCVKFLGMEDRNYNSSVKTKQYQAVFLTNGQVYFGKIVSEKDDYLKLENIYYLQVQQNVQPADTDKQQQLSLAKLGKELHGPENKMYISTKQVLFWENLKNDSQVVKAIKKDS